MENQNAFDDEGCMSSPLLDPSKSKIYATYRIAYAELLYLWGHPLSRLEVLKFNGLKDYFVEIDIPDNKSFATSVISTASHDASPPSKIVLGKKDRLYFPLPSPDQCLDVTGYCLKHESRLESLPSSTSGGAVGRCERCKAIQRQLRCTICQEPVSALFSPCLSCGCAAHQHCLQDYHSYGNTDCPGGCDCDCGASASAGIVESWEVMMGTIERMPALDTAGNIGDDMGDWDGGEKEEWDLAQVGRGLGRGSSMLSRKLEKVRTGDWGMGGNKKRASSLRKEESL